MSYEIIPNSRAIFLPKEKMIIIGDLHLEEDIDIANKLIKNVKKLVSKYKARKVLVNGDIFHFGMGGICVDLFEKKISKFAQVIILQGNHDPEVFKKFLTTKDYCISHGDYDYKQKGKDLILAHTHPSINGRKIFLQGTLKDNRKFIILPPFNEKQGCANIETDHLLGFVFTQRLVKNCYIIDLKGKRIGKFKPIYS